MKVNLKYLVGHKVKTLKGDFATVEMVGDDYIVISYKGRSYHRDHSVIGTSLFVTDENIQPSDRRIFDTPETIPEKNCKNCLLMRREDCNGDREKRVCDDFRPAPNISSEEMARWPKEGEASRYRKINHKK